MKNFEIVGNWWNNPNIELVKIGSVVYALDGWNGEKFLHCWECLGRNYVDVGKKEYIIKPIEEETKNGDFEVVRYEIL